MKLSKLSFKISAIALAGMISTTAFATNAFFEVGKSYLFIPRMDLVVKGTVTQVTDHEIVFTDRYLLKASAAAVNADNDDAKSGRTKSAAIAEYLKSNNKEALLEEGPLSHIPTSYSRSEMTAIKLD